MQWLSDICLFFAVPTILLAWSVLATHGTVPKSYKIVRESNNLGEERFEVWFHYPSFGLAARDWRMEEKFDRLQDAEDFITRQTKIRETVKEGKLDKLLK